MSACDPGRAARVTRRTVYLSVEAACLAVSAAAAVEAAESPVLVAAPALAGSAAGFGAVSVFAAPDEAPEGAGVDGLASVADCDAGFAAAFLEGIEEAGSEAGEFAADDADLLAAAFGFAAAFFAGFGFAAGVGLVGASAAAFAAADGALRFAAAFGFAAPGGFVVDDFGAFFAPAFGVPFFAAGLRVLVPAAFARAVRVEPGVLAPVFVPPARVGASATSVAGASSS